MSTPETATLSGQTMATITAAARTMYPHDALPLTIVALALRQADHIEEQLKAGAL